MLAVNLSEKYSDKTAVVIGGGPAGLMAAEVLSQAGVKVKLYDAMPSVGRKFLMAGKGGMNITHSEPYEHFLSRYGNRRSQVKPILDLFGPVDLRNWLSNLGIETFIGTSGRVFPADMKAAPLLRAWLHRLRLKGVEFYMRHQWVGWVENESNRLRFFTPDGESSVTSDAVILALGGASWSRLGSTGAWVPLLQQQGVVVEPLKPANCGFQVGWSEHFKNRFAGKPLKSVTLRFVTADGQEVCRQGEFVITHDGVEGGPIYALSSLLRETIQLTGEAIISLDMMPHRDIKYLIDRVSKPRGKLSLANHLRKSLGIHRAKAGLLRELASASDLEHSAGVAAAIKSLPIRLVAPSPIDEAISCAGGVSFEEIDEHLMIRALPGVFCAGEMLDWEAPTGGYLLNACFAMGRAAGMGALAWLQKNK
jgi:uncharacterized flavoprotein (TIGR03862 family)